MADTSLIFNVLAKDRGATKTLNKMKVAATVAFAAVGAAAAKFGMDSVKAYAEAEQSQLKLSDAFTRFPKLADTNIGRLRALNTELMNKTRFDDDALASGQAVLAQFKLSGTQLEKLTPLLADFAAKTGRDLPSAAGLLGKAFLGNTRALKELGINYKSTGNQAKDTANITALLQKKVGGFAEKEGKSAAGQVEILKNQFGELQETVGKALLPFLLKAFDAFKSFFAGIQGKGPIAGFTGAINTLGLGLRALIMAFKDGDVTSDGFVGKMEQIGVVAGKVWEVLDTKVRPVLQHIVKSTADFAGWLSRGSSGAEVFKAVVIGLTAAFVAYKLITGAITVATKAWVAVQAALNIVMSLNPIGIIILAIVALVAAVIYLWKTNEGFRKFFIAVWGAIWGFLKAVGAWFAGPFAGFFVKAAKAIWTGIKMYFGFWKGLLTTVVGWVIGAKDRIVNGFNKVVSFVKNLPGRISSAARGLFDGIKNAFRSAVNWLISKWNNLSFTLAGGSVMGINIPSITLSTPNIPYLAAGGIVTRPTLAVVGERGPEAVVPLSRGRGAAGVGGPSVIHVHVDGSRAARLLAELLREALRTNPTLRAEVRAA